MRMKARTLLEAFSGLWPKLTRNGDDQMGLQKLPPELHSLAENARRRDELLEHLANDVLYCNE